MKKQLYKNYQKPKIQENKLKTNFFSFIYRDPAGDLLADYCGQCMTCRDCYLPVGCDIKSC